MTTIKPFDAGGWFPIHKALQECLEAGYLLRYQEGTYRGKPAYVYSLNREYELDLPTGTETVPVATGTETVPVTGTETVPVTGTETVLTKQNKTNNKQSVGVVPTTEQQTAFAALTAIGVIEGTARELAQTCEPELVEAWVRYVRNAGSLTDKAAFVVAKLRKKEKPPVRWSKTEEEKRAERRARYIGGKYADLVQH